MKSEKRTEFYRPPPLSVVQRLRAWMADRQRQALDLRIDALERELAREFAVLETKPQLAELSALRAKRESLTSRGTRPQ